MVTQGALKFKFNPAQGGLGMVLGPLEAEVMAVVWQMEQATATDVHQALQIQRLAVQHKVLAYTTVMTTLSRLAEKHILRRRKVGVSWVYTPVWDQAEFARLVAKHVMDSLLAEFGEPVARYMVEYVAANDSLRQELSRMLAAPVSP